MKGLTKWVSALLAIVMLASTAFADTIASGQVMMMNPANKTFRLQFDKRTFKISESCVIRRGKGETIFKKTELTNGDEVQCYSDQPGGTLIRYILVRQVGTLPKGTGPDNLAVGILKRSNKTTAMISINMQDPVPFAIGDARVHSGMKSGTIADLKDGDKILIIWFITSGTQTMRDVIFDRK